MRYLSKLSLLFLALLLTACGGGEATSETTDDSTETATAPAPSMSAVGLTPMPATQEFPEAKIEGWKYSKGTYTYETSGYEFAVPTPDAEELM